MTILDTHTNYQASGDEQWKPDKNEELYNSWRKNYEVDRNFCPHITTDCYHLLNFVLQDQTATVGWDSAEILP